MRFLKFTKGSTSWSLKWLEKLVSTVTYIVYCDILKLIVGLSNSPLHHYSYFSHTIYMNNLSIYREILLVNTQKYHCAKFHFN